MKVAVVGATGWLGGAAAQEAERRGHHVTALSRSGAPAEALAALDAISRACAGREDVEVAIGLGGHSIDPDVRRSLERENVAVLDYFDQWAALGEADLFVTHHGLNSTHESIYQRTPMISYPFFADQPQLKVIVIYVEAVSNLETFKAACRMARAAGKHIVALKLGQSEGGREAALAHTGSLAGSIEAFDAVAGEAGVIRADTLDDVVELTELLAYTGAPSGRNLGAITLSGAFRGLLLDGAERNGLHFRPLEAATKSFFSM